MDPDARLIDASNARLPKLHLQLARESGEVWADLVMTEVLLPKGNEKDLPELPEPVRKGLELVFVEHVDELLAHALVEQPGQPGRGRGGRGGKTGKAAKPKSTPARRRSGATVHA